MIQRNFISCERRALKQVFLFKLRFEETSISWICNMHNEKKDHPQILAVKLCYTFHTIFSVGWLVECQRQMHTTYFNSFFMASYLLSDKQKIPILCLHFIILKITNTTIITSTQQQSNNRWIVVCELWAAQEKREYEEEEELVKKKNISNYGKIAFVVNFSLQCTQKLLLMLCERRT